jgi:hypothetical protein
MWSNLGFRFIVTRSRVNAGLTLELIQKQGGAPTAYLVGVVKDDADLEQDYKVTAGDLSALANWLLDMAKRLDDARKASSGRALEGPPRAP